MNIQGNLTGTYATEDVHAGKKPDDRRRLSPTVAATWRLLPEQSFFARLMYKNTFRMPTFNDQYYYRMGSTNLKPEKATEYNAGLTWSGSPARWIKYLSLTVDGYYNHVHDKIVAFPTTYVWKLHTTKSKRQDQPEITDLQQRRALHPAKPRQPVNYSQQPVGQRRLLALLLRFTLLYGTEQA